MTKKEIIERDEKMLNEIEKGAKIKSVDRVLKKPEMVQRGCKICTYVRTKSKALVIGEDLEKNERVRVCPFSHCPFHEMDKYENYSDFDKEQETKIHIFN